MTSEWDAYESAIRDLQEDTKISTGRKLEIFRALNFLIVRLVNLKITTKQKIYQLAIQQLQQQEKISYERRSEIFSTLRTLIRALHNEDHKTNHDSTYKIFDIKKGYQKCVDILKCDHQERADRFFEVENEEETKHGLRECEVCKVQYHISTIKEYFGLDVK